MSSGGAYPVYAEALGGTGDPHRTSFELQMDSGTAAWLAKPSSANA
jgi:hypothetical protein